MTSMDKVLDIIDRNDSSAKKTEDSAGGIKGSGKSSSDPDNDDEFGSILGELGEKNSAELAEDREFEELIRRSWKLYDEDMEFSAKPSTEVAPDESPTPSKQRRGSKTPKNKRFYHTSGFLGENGKPDKR
ncbi:hypothetical protein EV175_007662, partial [Coemansia sp. RSA 1933]